jgi:hypothetical protein
MVRVPTFLFPARFLARAATVDVSISLAFTHDANRVYPFSQFWRVIVMRIAPILSVAALGLATVALPARAQLFLTSITAAVPDPNDKVPGFNKVTGSGIENWSNGVAQAVLVHGQEYNYCVSLASATAEGKAEVGYKITQGATDVQSGTIITAKNFSIGSDSIWYFCSGY